MSIGGVELTADEIVDVESLRFKPNVSSFVSKMGEGGADDSELDMGVEGRSSSSSLYGRKSPYWIGGMKFFHRPSIRPIWKIFMRWRASGEWSLCIISMYTSRKVNLVLTRSLHLWPLCQSCAG